MGWLVNLLSKLPALFDATGRLVRAAKESLRPTQPTRPTPPPPIGESGARQASEYLRGYGDAQWKRHMDERAAGSAERLANALEDNDARSAGIEGALAGQPVDEEGEGKKP